ncbi:MAG: hypothetical protein J07HX5_00151 [halophilic archaeon J07HX5]|jgi:hypothetical protein|nr:MAG: hypothetical protein J07HX5_00151 [halophilic archaeon J07HX5]
MIIATSADGYRCITQHEHSKIAGRCALAWGNKEFSSPTPEESVVTATFTHDIGWREFDQRPRLNTDTETGNPGLINFHEVPAQTWVEMYEQGIETVAELDPYAGLVVSLHGVGLQTRRYGLTPEWNKPGEAFRAFIENEQQRQQQLLERIADQAGDNVSAEDRTTLARLHDNNQTPERYTGRLWCNYKLLQFWDTLSHLLCATTDQTVDTTIEHAPVSVGADVSIRVHSETATTYQLEPYPFSRDPLVIPAVARTVSEQTINAESEQAIAREYFASTTNIEFRLQS